ncbi:MAG: class IV adenylate cyclase [Chlorobi bacterium]|nr:class IV adenylate cyclase [Chlorobiota bacterium]
MKKKIVIKEIKARCNDAEKIREILKLHKARFVGVDRQTDTYFNCNNGRLKLREGNIENTLIHYKRENHAGPKTSKVNLYKPNDGSSLRTVLKEALDVLVTVDKSREIYFVDNIKFHIDTLEALGTFVEIEAIDETGEKGEAALQQQCETYLDLFGINENDLISVSYSDMVLELNK